MYETAVTFPPNMGLELRTLTPVPVFEVAPVPP